MGAIKTLMAAGVLLAFVTGCATVYPVGSVYTDVRLPVGATDNVGKATKVGTAECISIFSLVALGDASIEAAKNSAGITKVYHVDWDATNILGIYGKYRVTVYGE